ncbi:hypothetical protein E2562_014139, partial [Oryza meyeriana var. granulata]
ALPRWQRRGRPELGEARVSRSLGRWQQGRPELEGVAAGLAGVGEAQPELREAWPELKGAAAGPTTLEEVAEGQLGLSAAQVVGGGVGQGRPQLMEVAAGSAVVR